MATVVASQVAYDLIKHYESCRLKPYLDPNGFVTIGWGHKCTSIHPYADCAISQQVADDLLVIDVKVALSGIGKFTLVPLTQPQIDALTSLVYNIGTGNYFTSSLRRMLNMYQYHDAAEQFLVWDQIGGHHSHWQGQRRLAEHDLFLQGTK